MPFPALGPILAQLGRVAAGAATEAAAAAATRAGTQVAANAATGAATQAAAKAGTQVAANAAGGSGWQAARFSQWTQANQLLPTGKAVTGTYRGPTPGATPSPVTPTRPPPTPHGPPNPGHAAAPPIVKPANPSGDAAKAIADRLFEQAKGSATGLGSTLLYNSMAQAVGGRQQQQQSGGGVLAYLGAGPRTQQAASYAAGLGSTAMKAVDPGGLIRGTASVAHGAARLNPAVAAMEDLGKAAIQLPEILEGWGDELMASRQHLVQFSGAIAQAFGESQMRDMKRSINSGAATGGSTARLAKALDDFKDNVQPLKDGVANIANFVATGLLQMANGFAEILEKWKIIEDAAAWMKKAFPEEPKTSNINDHINRLAGNKPPKPGVAPKP